MVILISPSRFCKKMMAVLLLGWLCVAAEARPSLLKYNLFRAHSYFDEHFVSFWQMHIVVMWQLQRSGHRPALPPPKSIYAHIMSASPHSSSWWPLACHLVFVKEVGGRMQSCGSGFCLNFIAAPAILLLTIMMLYFRVNLTGLRNSQNTGAVVYIWSGGLITRWLIFGTWLDSKGSDLMNGFILWWFVIWWH